MRDRADQERLTARRLLILGWHNVDRTWAFPASEGKGRSGLGQQLLTVRRLAHVVDLAPALDDLRAGRQLPPRAVALTFDDGYRDNVTTVVPMLRELGLPATFFLVPTILSGDVPWWEVLGSAFATTTRTELDWGGVVSTLRGTGRRATYDAVCESLKRVDTRERRDAVEGVIARLEPDAVDVRRLFLDWDDARGLVEQGMAIGSHSLDHAILANEEPETQRRNLADSRRLLQEGLGVDVDIVAYPNGSEDDFDSITEAAARDAGYRYGVTTIQGWNTAATAPFRLRRFVMYPECGARGFRPVATYPLRRLLSRTD